MTSPLVSICIPVYNREKFIEETVMSALMQSYSNIEVVVVDNNSEDGTYEILKKLKNKYNSLKIFKNNTNIGPVKNWERCIELSEGQYVKLLYSDDILESTCIEKSIKPLMRGGDIAFVNTSVRMIDSSGRPICINNYFKKSGKYKSEIFIEQSILLKKISASASHALFRRADLSEFVNPKIVSKLDDNFEQHAIGIDIVMFLMISKKYKHFYYINEILVNYRSHSESITDSTDKSKLKYLKLAAIAYFVEKHIKNIDIAKQFNSTILYYIIIYRNTHEFHNKKIYSFYNDIYINKVNVIYLLKMLIKHTLKKILPKKKQSNI
jgi:glycosyltransferase involved in cell wall biosynthesis